MCQLLAIDISKSSNSWRSHTTTGTANGVNTAPIAEDDVDSEIRTRSTPAASAADTTSSSITVTSKPICSSRSLTGTSPESGPVVPDTISADPDHSVRSSPHRSGSDVDGPAATAGAGDTSHPGGVADATRRSSTSVGRSCASVRAAGRSCTGVRSVSWAVTNHATAAQATMALSHNVEIRTMSAQAGRLTAYAHFLRRLLFDRRSAGRRRRRSSPYPVPPASMPLTVPAAVPHVTSGRFVT